MTGKIAWPWILFYLCAAVAAFAWGTGGVWLLGFVLLALALYEVYEARQ